MCDHYGHLSVPLACRTSTGQNEFDFLSDRYDFRIPPSIFETNKEMYRRPERVMEASPESDYSLRVNHNCGRSITLLSAAFPAVIFKSIKNTFFVLFSVALDVNHFFFLVECFHVIFVPGIL